MEAHFGAAYSGAQQFPPLKVPWNILNLNTSDNTVASIQVSVAEWCGCMQTTVFMCVCVCLCVCVLTYACTHKLERDIM